MGLKLVVAASALGGTSSSSSSKLSLLTSTSPASRSTPRRDLAALPLLAAGVGTSFGHEHSRWPCKHLVHVGFFSSHFTFFCRQTRQPALLLVYLGRLRMGWPSAPTTPEAAAAAAAAAEAGAPALTPDGPLPIGGSVFTPVGVCPAGGWVGPAGWPRPLKC
jgi:hypothetical protein